MATNKRYKGYRKLNEMIDELESQVIYVNRQTGELVTYKSPTRTAIATRFQSVIDKGTGKILSFQDAKAKVESVTGLSYSYKEYIEDVHNLQDSVIGEQLTQQGKMEYDINRMESVLNANKDDESKVDIQELIDKFGYQRTRDIIDTIGRKVNELAKYQNYNSDVFYDFVYEALNKEKDDISEWLDGINNLGNNQ